MASLALATAGILALAAPERGGDTVHLGVGYELSQILAPRPSVADDPPRPVPAPTAARVTPAPRINLRPLSPDARRHLDQGRRARMRALKVAEVTAAVALQTAMIVYGILSVIDQRKQARAARALQPEPFNPHPR